MRSHRTIAGIAVLLVTGVVFWSATEPAQAMVRLVCWQDVRTGETFLNPKLLRAPRLDRMSPLDLKERHAMIQVPCGGIDEDDTPLDYLALFNSGGPASPPSAHWWQLNFWRH